MKDTLTNDWMHNLKELDCDDQMAAQVIEAVTTGNTDLASTLLRRQKRTLLEALHLSEKKVDLADFLLYQLKK